MIALLGATGYTGRLVAAELGRRGVACRLGARSPERLAELDVGPQAERFVVDVDDEARLDEFLSGARVLVNTVGPFARLGLPVVEAAVRNGVAYVDSTGETDFMEDVYLRFGAAPVPVVPACGFDYVPGDLAAAIAAADLGDAAEQITVAYDLRGVVPSRGTVASGLAALTEGRIDVAAAVGRMPFDDGERAVVRIPWGEQLTVPRHQAGAEVTSGIVLPRGMVPEVASAMLAPASFAWPLVRAGASALGGALVERLPEGPPPAVRERARFTIVATASTGDRAASVVCEGRDVYGLTARFLVEAAERLRGTGALAPAQALDPEPFLDAVSGDGFSWRRGS